MVSYGGHKQAY